MLTEKEFKDCIRAFETRVLHTIIRYSANGEYADSPQTGQNQMFRLMGELDALSQIDNLGGVVKDQLYFTIMKSLEDAANDCGNRIKQHQ